MTTVEGAQVTDSTFTIISQDIKNGTFTADISFVVDETTNATFTIPLYGAILDDLTVTFSDGESINAVLAEYREAWESVRDHQASSKKGASVLTTFTPSYMKIEITSAPSDEIKMKLVCSIKTSGTGEWVLPFVHTKNLVVTGKLRSPITCNIPLDITEIESDQAGDLTRYSTFIWQGESVENICIRQEDIDIESKLVSGDQNSTIALYVKGPEETPRDPHYYAFLGDSSGSMGGERIQLLKDALLYFLQNLAEHALDEDMIALFWFNTDIKAMNPRFITYREFKQMEEQWRSFITHEYADGSTELLPALEYISQMSGTNPTHIVVYTDSEVDVTPEQVEQWKAVNPNKKISTLTLSDEANPAAGNLFANATEGFSLHLLTAQLKGEALYGTMNNVMNILFHNVSYISAKIESDEAGALTPWNVWGSTSAFIPSGETGSIYFVGNVIPAARVTLTIMIRDPTGKQVSEPETRVLNLSSKQDSAIMKRAALETKCCFMKNGVMTLTKWLKLHRLAHDKLLAWFCLGQASREYEHVENVSRMSQWDDDLDRCISDDLLDRCISDECYYNYMYSDNGVLTRGGGDDEPQPLATLDAESKLETEMEQIYSTLTHTKLTISQYMNWFSSKEDMFLDLTNPLSTAIIHKVKKILVQNSIEPKSNMLSNLIAWVMLKKEFNKGMFGFYEKRAKKALEAMNVFDSCKVLENEVRTILKL